MFKISNNDSTKNYTMKKKEITQCGYMGYEFDSGTLQMDFGSAITTAIALMKLSIVQSVSVLTANEIYKCTYTKDHEMFNGNRIIYEHNIDTALFRRFEYKKTIITIRTYHIPVKHLNHIIYKIDDFEELLNYMSVYFLNPVCKPTPKFGSEKLSIQDRVDLINYKEMDYKINYDPENTDEEEDFEYDYYYEMDATLSRDEVLELEQAIVTGSTRIEAIMYLDEEYEFVTNDNDGACPYMWEWYEEIMNLNLMLFYAPTFDVDLNYFKVAVKLSVSDLETIKTFDKVKDVLKYLKK